MKLSEELATDPLNLGYAVLLPHSPGSVANILNRKLYTAAAPGVTYSPRGAAAKFPAIDGLPGPLAFQLVYRKLKSYAVDASASDDITISLLGDAIKLQLDYFGDGLDFGAPAMREMLDLICANGGINSDELSGLKSLGERLSSRADVLGLGRITDADVRAAWSY